MKMLEKLKSGEYSNIWIYGAGKVGKKLWNDFHFFRIKVNGFVVSKYDGVIVPEAGIWELDDIVSDPEDTLFVITTSRKFHDEIIKNLHVKGYNNYIIWDDNCLSELWSLADYTFEDRRKGKDKCCFILAGYKEFLWNNVFDRIERFIPMDVEVCIVSSGLYNAKLSEIATRNGWSYLATRINSVTLVQNVAFSIYKGYEWIYKLDEDIFVTEGAFENLIEGYLTAEKNSGYQIGVSAPLIPVNGYGYRKILEKYGKAAEYEKRFGVLQIGGNPDSEIEKNPESAVFMWGELPQLDEINRDFHDASLYEICGVRFSIGFILMRRSFWLDMQGFSVSGNADMGTDEEEVCANCINRSRAIAVCERAVVGHFSFGRQTEMMREYYAKNREWFDVH